MEALRNNDIRIDLDKVDYISKLLKQLDTTELTLLITKSGVVQNITNNTFILYFKKGDGTIVTQTEGFDTSQGAQGILKIELDIDCVRASGTGSFEIHILKDGNKISSFQVECTISATIMDGVPSSNKVTLIEQLENTILEGINTRDELEEVIETADLTTYASRQDVNELSAHMEEKVNKQGDILGGVVPSPFRVPTVNVFKSFPTDQCPYIPCWIDGSTIYAYGRDSTLRKSTDGGRTFIKKGYNAYGFGAYDCFLKCKDGSLLNIQSATNPPTIQRSIDDGVTWTMVYTLRTNIVPLGSQSLCIDDNTGYIYLGEYNKAPTDKIGVIISKDNGATWQEFYMWEGENTTVGTPNRIRHVHAVQYDPVDNRIIICTGDSTNDTGLWRTTQNGLSVEKIIVNSMLPSIDIDSPRCIGIMTFPNYIAWGADTTYMPYLFRIARSEIGKPNPMIEKIYRLNSSGWFTCKASSDNSLWLFSASQEGTSIDNLCHLYAVSNEGKTCWEVGSFATNISSVSSSLQPVGVPQKHGESLYLVTRGFDTKQVWNLQISQGFTQVPRPSLNSETLCKQTFNSPNVSLSPGQELIFGTTVAGGLARNLNIFECGVGEIDAGGSVGNLKLQIKKRSDGNILYETANASDRYTTRQDMGLEMFKVLLTGGDKVDFIIKNIHAGITIKCSPSVTFGWGLA